jgi:hypothetical protein
MRKKNLFPDEEGSKPGGLTTENTENYKISVLSVFSVFFVVIICNC